VVAQIYFSTDFCPGLVRELCGSSAGAPAEKAHDSRRSLAEKLI